MGNGKKPLSEEEMNLISGGDIGSERRKEVTEKLHWAVAFEKVKDLHEHSLDSDLRILVINSVCSTLEPFCYHYENKFDLVLHTNGGNTWDFAAWEDGKLDYRFPNFETYEKAMEWYKSKKSKFS